MIIRIKALLLFLKKEFVIYKKKRYAKKILKKYQNKTYYLYD